MVSLALNYILSSKMCATVTEKKRSISSILHESKTVSPQNPHGSSRNSNTIIKLKQKLKLELHTSESETKCIVLVVVDTAADCNMLTVSHCVCIYVFERHLKRKKSHLQDFTLALLLVSRTYLWYYCYKLAYIECLLHGNRSVCAYVLVCTHCT